jgi:hypothetical protein
MLIGKLQHNQIQKSEDYLKRDNLQIFNRPNIVARKSRVPFSSLARIRRRTRNWNMEMDRKTKKENRESSAIYLVGHSQRTQSEVIL